MNIKPLLLGVFLLLVSNTALAKQAAIASAHPMATEAGLTILQKGGNAFDAAVAVSSVLAVVEPYSSGIGGGGFWLLHRNSDNYDVMLDGREKAPLASHRDLYLDKEGNVVKGLSLNGAMAAGIPGEPAALAWLAENMGTLPLSETLKPAINIADNGFAVDKIYQRMAKFRHSALLASDAASDTFLQTEQVPEIGTIIKQPDLANTLRAMAKHGKSGFYEGEVAKKLIEGVQQAGGIWTEKDLLEYDIVLREPISIHYQDMTITSVNLPSSGGIVMAEILNMLNDEALQKKSDVQKVHWLVETMRRAYRDRAAFLGDSDFINVPSKRLLSPDYAMGLKQSIRPDQVTQSRDLAPTYHHISAGTDTTHFSIIDHDGNRVAATLSINYPFGSCFVPPGTGVLLNNEMDDFSIKPGEPNAYGLVGNAANAIEPGKRMLSSMSPTFVEDEQRLAVIGTPGGSRIITMVLLGLLEFHQGKSAEDIVNAPRFHHQYLPDAIQVEPNAFNDDLQTALKDLGHQLDMKDDTWGNMQIVIQDKTSGQLTAASDKRGIGLSKVIENK